MAEWQYGNMVWQYGRMAVRQYGSMAEWQYGNMAVWQYQLLFLKVNKTILQQVQLYGYAKNEGMQLVGYTVLAI